MDPRRFDGLVATLARPASRRAALASLLGGAVAGVLDRTAAASRPKDGAATQDNQAKAKPRPGADATPTSGANAARGRSCPSGKKQCDGRCIPQRRSCPKSGKTCRDNGQPCKKDGQCCSNKCDNRSCAPNLGCSETGVACTQDSDCCTANCFNFVCAERVTQCSAGGTTTPCRPPAKGCAGAKCCHGALSCNDGCCQGAANQCNPQGNCCTPNCNGRECGDDGCGNGGTCGSCPTGQTCSANGKCQGKPTCSAATCPNGCCDKNGACQPGNTEQACGTGGQACVNCPGGKSTCQNGQCTCAPQCHGKECGDDGCGGSCGTCPTGQACDVQSGKCKVCSPQTCPNGCCDANGACRTDQHGCRGAGSACCAGCCDENLQCQPGNSDFACGVNGGFCGDCAFQGHCVNGQCQCDAAFCPNGCCPRGPGNPGICIEAGSRNDLCGFGGAQCVACPGGTPCNAQGECKCSADGCPDGTVCNAQGECECRADLCTASSGRTCQNNQCVCTAGVCKGCCQDNVCKPGNTDQICGVGGVACKECSGSTPMCLQGQCLPKANTYTCKCNNGTTVTACFRAACGQDSIKIICRNICASHGGWGNIGTTGRCVPESCEL